MTVVLDCNYPGYVSYVEVAIYIIYQSLIKGKFKLIITLDILLEYEEVLQQKYSFSTARTFITLLNELSNVAFINTFFQWHLISKDLDDNKYCDCAIAGQADYIVTEDKHFDVLKNIPFPSLTTLNIEQFLKVIENI